MPNIWVNKQHWIKYLAVFLLPFLLILLSFKTTIIFSEYTPQQQETVNYLLGRTELLGGSELPNPAELPENYTIAEYSHLQDVQRIFSVGNILFWILASSAIFLILLIFFLKKNILEISNIILHGGIITLMAIILIFLLIFFNFNGIFAIFHKIFFPQGNWQFPANSLLIQTFPLQFFIKMSFLIFFQALIWGILFILTALFLKRTLQKSKKNADLLLDANQKKRL